MDNGQCAPNPLKGRKRPDRVVRPVRVRGSEALTLSAASQPDRSAQPQTSPPTPLHRRGACAARHESACGGQSLSCGEGFRERSEEQEILRYAQNDKRQKLINLYTYKRLNS